jgi:hypothetical protein
MLLPNDLTCYKVKKCDAQAFCSTWLPGVWSKGTRNPAGKQNRAACQILLRDQSMKSTSLDCFVMVKLAKRGSSGAFKPEQCAKRFLSFEIRPGLLQDICLLKLSNPGGRPWFGKLNRIHIALWKSANSCKSGPGLPLVPLLCPTVRSKRLKTRGRQRTTKDRSEAGFTHVYSIVG